MLRYAKVFHDMLLAVAALIITVAAVGWIYLHLQPFENYVNSYVVVPVSGQFEVGTQPKFHSFAEFTEPVKAINWKEVQRCDFSQGGDQLDYFAPSEEYDPFRSFAADYAAKSRPRIQAIVDAIVTQELEQSVEAAQIREVLRDETLPAWTYGGKIPSKPGWCQFTHTVNITVGPFNMEKSSTFTSAMIQYVTP